MPKAKPIQLFGQCKDNMKIGTWQEILLPGKYPSLTIRTLTFWTMPVAAGIVRDPFVCTGIASIYMSTKIRCSTMLNSIEYTLMLFEW
jgi:hypothetical protein